MLGVLSSIRHPPKILVFGLVFGCAWSAHGRRHGARGLIPEGKPYRALACGPITSGGRIYTLTRHSRPPGTPPVLSSPFPLSFLACPFTSFHFTAASAPFISLKTPSFAFLSLFDLSFSCSLVSLQRPLHSRAMSLTCISFTFQSLLFHFSPLFRIASMHSIIRISRDDAGNAGGVVQY